MVSPPVKYAAEGMAAVPGWEEVSTRRTQVAGVFQTPPAADGQLLLRALITAHIRSGRGSADLHYGCDFPQSFEERRGVGCCVPGAHLRA